MIEWAPRRLAYNVKHSNRCLVTAEQETSQWLRWRWKKKGSSGRLVFQDLFPICLSSLQPDLLDHGDRLSQRQRPTTGLAIVRIKCAVVEFFTTVDFLRSPIEDVKESERCFQTIL